MNMRLQTGRVYCRSEFMNLEIPIPHIIVDIFMVYMEMSDQLKKTTENW